MSAETGYGTGTFDCPIAWCDGRTEEHGGDGGSPDDWLHSCDVARPALRGSRTSLVQRIAEGGGPSRVSLVVSVDADYALDEAREVAAELRAIAEILEGVAAW
ncbi:DUF6907 domain-containing protein [Microbacterium sp. F2]|uniref:DUF6907 domain-containing protein n=1 Tax=Microbacterium sp. F2 TaxID=3422228 RepID=UPI003FD60FBB